MTLEKPAYNEEWRTFDFSPQLAAGETITTPVVIITDENSIDTSSSMVASVSVSGTTSIRYMLKGGTVGKVYTRQFRVVTTSGNKLEDSVLLRII